MGIQQTCRVNTKLIPCKIAFFCLYGGVGAFLTYLALFLRQQGLSPSESSIIMGTMPFLAGFTRPLVGSLADKLRRHKLILVIISFLSGLVIVMMLLVPAQQMPSSPVLDIRLECKHQLPYISICPAEECVTSVNDREDCVLQCAIEGLDGSSPPTGSDQERGNISIPIDFRNHSSLCITARVLQSRYSGNNICNGTNAPLCELHCTANGTKVDECKGKPFPKFGTMFWSLWLLYFVGGVFYYPTFGLLDALTYQLLAGEITNWGMQRSFGTLGFAVLGFGTGYLMEVRTTDGGHANFTVSLMGFFVCHLLLAGATLLFKTSRDVKCDSIFINSLHLLRNVKVFSLVVVLFIFGAFYGITEGILFWHLKTLGAPGILLGMIVATQALPEFVMLFMSGPIISRIGDVNCIYLGSVAYIIRFVAYATIRNPWLVLLPELLHGFTFALFFASSTVYMASVTPPGMKATVQNLVRSIHYSFGRGTGAFMSGALLEACGGPHTFYGCAAVAAVTLLGYMLTQFYIRYTKRRSDKSRPPIDDLYSPQDDTHVDNSPSCHDTSRAMKVIADSKDSAETEALNQVRDS